MNNCRLSDQELIDLQVLHQKLFNKREADRVKLVALLCFALLCFALLCFAGLRLDTLPSC